MERKESTIVQEEPEGTLRRESQVTTAGAAGAVESEVVDTLTPARRTIELAYLVFGAVDAVLIIRMALKLMGANANAGFASFVYGLSGFFLGPFHGLFPAIVSGSSIFELSVLIAILIYSLVGIGLAQLLAIAFSRRRMVSRKSRSPRLTTRSE